VCLNYSPYCCPEVSRLLSLSFKSSVLTLDHFSSVQCLASSLRVFHLEVLFDRILKFTGILFVVLLSDGWISCLLIKL